METLLHLFFIDEKLKHENKKKMRIFTTVLSLCILAVFSHCGDEGVGFNIGKEFPLDIPIEAPISDFNIPNGGAPSDFNPPALPAFSESYDLNDVDDFQNDAIESVAFESLSYEISGVGTTEEVELDELSIETNIGTLLSLTNQTLTNSSKQSLNLTQSQKDQLADILDAGGTITTDLVFDFAEVPDEDLSFTYTLYFDTVVKIRD